MQYLVRTPAELTAMSWQLAETAGPLVVDVETTGLDRFNDTILGIAIATANNEWYVVLGDANNDVSSLFECWATRTLIGHNVVFDMHFLARYGLDVASITWWDTMQMAHLWEDNLAESGAAKLLSLKTLASTILGYEMQGWEEGFKDQPVEAQTEYAAKDARATYDLADWLRHRLKAQGLWGYYTNRCSPLLPVVFKMEQEGFKVDLDMLDKLRVDWETEKDAAYAGAVELAETDKFNPASPKQLVQWFLDRGVDLPETKSGKNLSAAEEALQPLVGRKDVVGEMARVVLRFRKANKMLNTYIFNARTGNGLTQLGDSDGRVHPRWNYTGTVTGRFSCAHPNLQNIPLHGEGRALRDVFVAKDGYVLVVADMSQAEVRMLAALSQDKHLISLLDTEDIHSEVAAQLFGTRFTQLQSGTPEWADLRHRAKTIVFGIIYGRGPGSIAHEFGITIHEAQIMIDTFYQRFAEVQLWRQQAIIDVMQRGEVQMWHGRRRRPILLRRAPPSNTPERQVYNACYHAEVRKTDSLGETGSADRGQRQAVNALIQGSVAEVINQAIIKLDFLGYHVVAQIHDEILLEVPHDDDIINRAVYHAMAALSPVVNGVQFTAKVAVVNRWGEAK